MRELRNELTAQYPSSWRNLNNYICLIAPGNKVVIVFNIAKVSPGPLLNANTSY